MSERPTRNGGWLHLLRSDPSPRARNGTPPRPQTSPPAQETPRADVDKLDGVYSQLLKSLPLAPQHRHDLRRRGLSDGHIARIGFASTPSQAVAAHVVEQLAPLGLDGVPGFYRERGSWRMVGMFKGYFVPYRDAEQRICGLQYRLEQPIDDAKYIWLSSATDREGKARDGGSSSGSPVHFARPDLLAGASEVIITEGGLKAEIIAALIEQPVIAAAGVTTFGEGFAARLRRSFPQLQRVVIAFDADLWIKPQVFAALERLAAQLERARFFVRIRTWPQQFKGFDDYLLAQVRGEEVAA
jgi:hypothetical protein